MSDGELAMLTAQYGELQNVALYEGEMSAFVSSMNYWPDSRGNRLEYWTVTQVPEGHILWLRGPEEAARQVLTLSPEYERLPASVIAHSVWTHALRSAGPGPAPEVQNLLDLLVEVITLPSLSSLEFAVALD